MRGTPIHRTILVWTCVFALTFAGCAANRSSVLPDGSVAETFHALAVIPAHDVPEINVVRMGNSRVVGALQGAGRGFAEGVAAVATSTGGYHGSGGEGDVAFITVMVAVMLSVGIVNAVIEGVKGSRIAAPYETVSDPDEATRRRITSLEVQKGFALLVEEEAKKRLAVPVSLKDLPEGKADDGGRILRELGETGVDAALRVEIVRVGFEGRVGENQPLVLAVILSTKIVRTADGTTALLKTAEYRSAAVPPEEWVKDDFLRVRQVVDEGVRNLAKRCVDDIVRSGLFAVPVHDPPDPADSGGLYSGSKRQEEAPGRQYARDDETGDRDPEGSVPTGN